MDARIGKTKEQSMTSSAKVAGVLLLFKDEVLLLKRGIKGGELEGYWSVPCGMVEENETAWSAASRELYEETLIRTKYDLSFINKFKITKNREFYCYLYSISERIRPNIIFAQDGHEHNDWDYFSIDNLPEPIDPDLKKTILMTKEM